MTTRSPELETRQRRLKLAIRNSGHNVNVAPGVRLNYRRSAKTSGTWSVLLADGKRSASMKRIATADDFEDANGVEVLDFWQAQKAALAIARGGHTEQLVGRAVFSKADLSRALAAAKKAGVEIAPDRTMKIIML